MPDRSPIVRRPASEQTRRERLLQLVLPPALQRGGHTELRAQVLVISSLVFMVVVALVALYLEVAPMPHTQIEASRLLLACLELGLAGSLLALRLTASQTVAANMVLCTVFVALCSGASLQGGIDAASNDLYVVIPVLAAFLSGRRAAVFWTCAVFATWAAMWTAASSAIVLGQPLPAIEFRSTRTLTLSISLLATGSVAYVYESFNRQLRKALARERAHFEHEAGHDFLTGLPNRRRFTGILDASIRRAQRTKTKVALVMLDLNGFKPINDRFGHAAGDRVLQEFATALRGWLRSTDSVARMGGDEFAIAIELVDSRENALAVVEQLVHDLRLAEPSSVEARNVSASLGVALYPEDASEAEELLEAADAAMYRAKSCATPFETAGVD